MRGVHDPQGHMFSYFSPEERRVLFARVHGCLAGHGVFALQTPIVTAGRITRALGADASTATFDLFLRREALYPLSYWDSWRGGRDLNPRGTLLPLPT